MGTDDRERIEIDSRAALRAWLAAHAAQTDSVWLVRYKVSVPEKHIPYDELVTELLCFGWIDSHIRKHDEHRTRLLISPRKKGSVWSAKNKRHVAEIEAAGLMMPTGQAAIDRAKADGSWTILDDVEALVVPADLHEAFDAHPGARTQWDAFPRSAKKAMLWWVKSAKRAETRLRRVTAVASEAAQGRRAQG